MMIDMNGPDMQTEDHVNALILEGVNVWRHYTKRVPQGAVHVSPDRPGAHRSRAEEIFIVNSGDLSMWFLMNGWVGSKKKMAG